MAGVGGEVGQWAGDVAEPGRQHVLPGRDSPGAAQPRGTLLPGRRRNRRGEAGKTCSEVRQSTSLVSDAARFCRIHILTYRCLHGLGPDYLSSDFTSFGCVCYTTLHTWRPTRSSVIGARLWNSLPDDIVTATSFVTFRHKLKTFLFRWSYDDVDTWLLDNLLFVLSFYFLVFIS